ncbi:hypothetical protein DFP72DRAFT_850341 [Ephemerocybe angulata]|uniref:C2H2-type domain-containing protein n=1 Tax=Ephemerocybe angulata TaxID=980116 RepID=A0A8H6HSA0_9AGAR|nr:hypothetical protein DFP72DRAFT_850341 [Tulosesus angulatus]
MSGKVYQSCHSCGKEYLLARYLNAHEKKCKTGKRGIALLLDQTKALWEARKRRRMEAVESGLGEPNLEVGMYGSNLREDDDNSKSGSDDTSQSGSDSEDDQEMANELDKPIALRKSGRVGIGLPLRYRDNGDIVPGPAPPAEEQASDGEESATEGPLNAAVQSMQAPPQVTLLQSHPIPPPSAQSIL